MGASELEVMLLEGEPRLAGGDGILRCANAEGQGSPLDLGGAFSCDTRPPPFTDSKGGAA
jgi:hypothetical protein